MEMSYAAPLQDIYRLHGRFRHAIGAITGKYIPGRSVEKLVMGDPIIRVMPQPGDVGSYTLDDGGMARGSDSHSYSRPHYAFG